jgi:hypothetical protein
MNIKADPKKNKKKQHTTTAPQIGAARNPNPQLKKKLRTPRQPEYLP